MSAYMKYKRSGTATLHLTGVLTTLSRHIHIHHLLKQQDCVMVVSREAQSQIFDVQYMMKHDK